MPPSGQSLAGFHNGRLGLSLWPLGVSLILFIRSTAGLVAVMSCICQLSLSRHNNNATDSCPVGPCHGLRELGKFWRTTKILRSDLSCH